MAKIVSQFNSATEIKSGDISYDSLILVATAETNEVLVSSDYVPDESLYNMLKVLVNANALENANEKINVFYLYGKLSDEMYIDLIMGDDM